ncbi:MFS transporter [Microbacterium sp. 18062]|uniref:MFS transporter n=1 Tax=Microbacterium sp. 18062 TaxID=2681410 RepID=UPI00135801C4|nr:MFS transporter [Microbacterium sp. 18062]
MPNRLKRSWQHAEPDPVEPGTKPLKHGLLISFTLPTIVLGVMHGPEGLIQGVYAEHAGISLGSLALALLLTKVFDAVTYPLIGSLSDRTYARTGSRRSWLIAGTALSVVGIWFLLRPPGDVDVWYFGIWMAVTYLGWKIIEIPLQAWSYVLTSDYKQRARVQGWRGMGQVFGQLLFFLIPLLAMQVGVSDTTELNFDSLGLAAIICVVALPLASLVLILRVPNRDPLLPPQIAEPGTRMRWRELWASIRTNPPLLRLLAAFLPVNLLTGMSGGLVYLYMDTYLGLGAQLPAILGIALLTAILGIPIWTALSGRFERHRVWAVALVLGGLACASLALVSPGHASAAICFMLYPVVTLVLAGTVAVYTMSADIVDYGRLHTGRDHGGLYGSMFAFLQKSLQGVSAAIGLALVGAFGFDATSATQTMSAVIGIKIGFALAPALGLLAAAAIIWNYPLNRAKVSEIQIKLAARDAAEAAAEPLTGTPSIATDATTPADALGPRADDTKQTDS